MTEASYILFWDDSTKPSSIQPPCSHLLE